MSNLERKKKEYKNKTQFSLVKNQLITLMTFNFLLVYRGLFHSTFRTETFATRNFVNLKNHKSFAFCGCKLSRKYKKKKKKKIETINFRQWPN